jgi:hypothetical protein
MNPNLPETLDDELPPDNEEKVEMKEDKDFDDDGQPDSYKEHLDFAGDDGPYYDDGDF